MFIHRTLDNPPILIKEVLSDRILPVNDIVKERCDFDRRSTVHDGDPMRIRGN